MSAVEPGTYKAKATTWEFGQSKAGTDYIKVMFQIEEGPEAGKNLSWFGYLSEKTAERTFEALRAAGWSEAELSDEMGGLGDVSCLIVADDEEYNGKAYTRIKWVNPVRTKRQPKKADAGTLKALNSKLSRHIARSLVTSTAPSDSSDDLPF